VRRALLAVLFLPLAGCTSFKKINVYTVPQEMAVGEVFSSQVEAQYPILNDPYIDWYLNHRGRLLADLSDRADIPYTFKVVDSPELNAFAIPGGHVYLNLGMIEALESESALLGVVGHEIGHVIAKHSMKQISQQTIIGIIGTVALNQYPNQWAALAANLFGTAGFLKMSRDAEREADAIGFDLLVRAGFDPSEMASTYQVLLDKYHDQPGMLDKLFTTHPPSVERIENIRAMAEARKLPSNLQKSTPSYRTMYDHLVKTYYTEPGRRRWKDLKSEQQDEIKKKEDRLPWDRRSDEQKKKEEEREKARRDKQKQKDDEKNKDRAPVPPAEPEATPDPQAQVPAAGPQDPGAADPLVARGGASGVRR
jgi:predicted Zn-dependent protease